MTAHWTAVVLAGGRGRRMGGVEKAAVRLGEATLLDHVLAGLPADVEVVVVGPTLPVTRPVTFRLEEPRFGGPVAGLAAALPEIRTPAFVLLATDMPHAGVLAARLAEQLPVSGVDALVPIDAGGRRQHMCSALRTEAVRRALAGLGEPHGAAMRTLLDGLEVREVSLAGADAGMLRDIDTPDDLAGIWPQSRQGSGSQGTSSPA